MDRARFPATAAYLDGMPLGADSYPNYRAKASLYRGALDARPLPSVGDALPPSVVDLIEHPKPVSAWVTEAQQRAILYAIFDQHFAADQPAFLRWVYEQNRKLFASPLYRVLMLLVSPAMMLRSVQTRWSAFHDGISVKGQSSTDGTEIVMHFPVGLVVEHDLLCHAASFRAAIDAAGAQASEVSIVQRKPSEAHFRATWS